MVRRVLGVIAVAFLIVFAPVNAWAATNPIAAGTASSYLNAGYPAGNAFDGNTATEWASNTGGPWWYQVELSTAAAATVYTVQCQGDGNRPTGWVFQGSNDGTTFSALNTQTAQTFTSGAPKSYTFVNTTAYKYYRWSSITAGTIVTLQEVTVGDGSVPGPPPAPVETAAKWTDPMTPASLVATVGAALSIGLLGIVAVGVWRR